MTILLDTRIPRALDVLLGHWAGEANRGAHLEAWLFEDEEARREGERALARAGVTARLRSAYKPLVHAFLEDIDMAGLSRVTVRYPVHEEADSKRFLSEAYPLAALLDGVETIFEPAGADLTYRVTAEYEGGRIEEHAVFAPNRLRTNHLAQIDLTPTGWLKVTTQPSGAPDLDQRLETEAEQVFQVVMQAIIAHEWPAQEPYAETLAIDVAIPGIERPLGYDDEVMSTREALHEDFYFSLLEFFKHKSGRPPEDRSLQPGQIVPDIRAGEGDAHVRVELRSFGAPQDPVRADQDLETADAAPGLAQIHRELAALQGETFAGLSREGRPVRGLYRSGSRPAVLVTGGQHANETSAPVGALRAVRRLLADPEANIAFIPVENPDGYALHAFARAIRATCIMRRAIPRSATIWNTTAATRPTRRARASRRCRCRARSSTSISTATRPMNGRGPSRAICRAASSCGRSPRASSWSCVTSRPGPGRRAPSSKP
jgi:hypothetical protein